jgi:hypothetical protein
MSKQGPQRDSPTTVAIVVFVLVALIIGLLIMDWQDAYGVQFDRRLLPVVMLNHFQPEYPMQPLPTAVCSFAGVCGAMPYPVYALGPDDPYWCTVVLDPHKDPCQQTWLPGVYR